LAGRVYYNLKDYKGAIADESQSLQLKPKQIKAYLNRASARSATGDLSGGLNDLDRAIEIDPNKTAPYNNRGLLRLKQGDNAGALKELNKAIAKFCHSCSLLRK
jgi:tetratricopeptide (TPR) repeat protein